MNLKDLKIKTLLFISFGIMIFFVLVLGVVAYRQSDQIQSQTELFFNHPFQTRSALGRLNTDIANMRLYTRDLMLAVNDDEKQKAVASMNNAAVDVKVQFDRLFANYLGSRADVEDAYKVFLMWENVRAENTRLALAGKTNEVKQNVQPDGKVGKYRVELLNKLKVIDAYASKKSVTIFNYSNFLLRRLNLFLIILVFFIVVLFLFVFIFLFQTIKNPTAKLTDAVIRFNQGDLNVRTDIKARNEFGILSDSFNNLVENVQLNIELSNKMNQLSDIMMQAEDAHMFFRKLFPVLVNITNSQMAAVYLLSSDKKIFKHYESIGLNDEARELSFKKETLDGELGSVLTTKTIQHIKSIPFDTAFVFNTISGGLVPREIISIPILSSGEVVAIISLASIRTYSDQTNELINRMYDVLNARIEGVLTYRKLRDFSKRLEVQNAELEAQKNELDAQSNELKEQNQELEMQKNQLSEVSQLKTNFLSNMSHELRTPLNSVIALAGVLNRRLEGKIPADEYSYLEVIERNGKNLLELINNILDISRIEAGKEEMEFENFDVNALLADVYAMIKPQADQNNIELVHLNNDSALFIQSDRSKCLHILQNLVGNAVKFTEKGQVTVSASMQNNRLEIKVKDTGIGISEKHLPHIFDEFRQADGSTSRRFGGTGLGLSIALKYAHLLNGDIRVESKINEGSTFILELPVKSNPIPLQVPTTTKQLQFRKENAIEYDSPVGKTLLLVEDSEPAIVQMKDILDDIGYNILVAQNGSEALRILNGTIPDAMILDLMMPGIDGFEVLENIRNFERTAHIPVLILTAKHITKEDLKQLKRNNVHQLIQKGDVKKSELLNAIASMFVKPHESKPDVPQERPRIEGKPLVLVIEDNPDNLLTVKALLSDNFDVVTAETGVDGITMAQELLPHIILMDLSLPEIDGFEAFRRIRLNPDLEKTPVIALTASALASDRERILTFGFDGYVAKPIDTTTFYDTINRLLYGI